MRDKGTKESTDRPNPPKVFITYSHKDKKQKDRLITHLKVMSNNKEIDTWHDNEMLAGDRWRTEIKKHIDTADILLYLTSADSLASTECNKELAEAMVQYMRVIPIILKPCDWKNHHITGINVPQPADMAEIKALPPDGTPISRYNPRDTGWQEVVDGIRDCIKKIPKKNNSSTRCVVTI